MDKKLEVVMNDVFSKDTGEPVTIPVFKTNFNAELFPDEGEENSGEVVTIPDQSMPIIEILKRYSNGIPFEEDEGFYEEEGSELLPANWMQLDLSQKYDYIREAAEKTQETLDAYNQVVNQMEEQRKKDEIIKKYEDERKEFEKNIKPIENKPQ